MTQTEAFIALNMLPRIGPVRVRKLLEVFGSPEPILEARPADLRNVQGIGTEVAESILSWRSHVGLEKEIDASAALEPRSSRSQILPTLPCSEKSTILLLSSMYGESRRSTRHRHRRDTEPLPLCCRMREKARLPTRLRRLNRSKRLGAWNRYGGAPSCARGEGADGRGPRQWIRRSLSS